MTLVERDLATAALCWRIERRDGAAIGFTSHDRDLVVAGFRYRAAPGMLPSAIRTSDGFDVDRLEIEGALTASAIAAADLAAGRWDGAALSIFLADWEDPEAETIPIARGELGDVTARGRAFEAELRGPTALLERPVTEQTSPECRARLGDSRCRVDMAGRTRLTRVASVAGEAELIVEAAAPGNGHGGDRLRWLGGPNSGLESAIASSDGTLLRLREPPFHPALAGDLVLLVEGCDKSFATCSARFANAANFRGEPHLPGLDLLTRYPGA